MAQQGEDEYRVVDRTGRLAFAPARFGPGIAGGAEIVLGRMAYGLAERGWNVEILTSTALDHYTWRNDLPSGTTVENGLTVRRFETVITPGSERAWLEQQILAGEQLPIGVQQRWMNGGARSPGLFHHLLDHSQDYRAVVFGPYPFWPAFACSQIDPSRSVLWACLHDEPYAYLDLFQPVFTGIAGILLQTEPEHQLAHRVVRRGLSPHEVVGCGVEVPESYDVDAFCKRYDLKQPFVLYAGRREGAKGWEEFLAAFAHVVHRRALPFSLVTIGVGDVKPPADIADRVIDLGFLADRERDSAFAAAAAYVQTSQYEAFSRTVMEAWLAGTPVIANRKSDVVTWHCERSGAGLLYSDLDELEECLAFVADAPDAAEALGRCGRPYVLENYQWPGVLDRVEECIAAWTKG
jgi:glycosyltransferase involved in cell wall biosynthesis